jgi:hypothetical protein
MWSEFDSILLYGTPLKNFNSHRIYSIWRMGSPGKKKNIFTSFNYRYSSPFLYCSAISFSSMIEPVFLGVDIGHSISYQCIPAINV